MKEFAYKKSLGQNFLKDKSVINKIIDSADITVDSLILEIGPGSGALTKELVKTKGKVVAFEIDERLKEELSKIESNNLEVIYGDFLKIDLKEVLNKYNYKKLHLIANLPYYITTPIIMKIINETKIDEMIIMVQKEVGSRFKAKPNTKEYNSLSVFLQYYFDIKTVTIVNKNSFVPKPKVDSIVVRFSKKYNKIKANNEKVFFKLVKDSFTFKRKNLKNNLKGYDLNKINIILNKFNKDLTFRAESLSLEEFIEISNNI
ncbi:MAG: ribosomal RNA small subunit methyltransferase A [Bacilli bacterium]|nr:ribosomal RNA small subunit methyltransferase A [Bacilli bacterium]